MPASVSARAPARCQLLGPREQHFRVSLSQLKHQQGKRPRKVQYCGTGWQRNEATEFSCWPVAGSHEWLSTLTPILSSTLHTQGHRDSSTGTINSREPLAIPGDIFDRQNWEVMQLAFTEYRPGMLLIILEYTGKPLKTKTSLSPDMK